MNNQKSMDSRFELETIKSRKKEGIDIPLKKGAQARATSTYLEYVRFVHNALPEIDYTDIETSCFFMNRRFSAPLIIDSMTGGTPEARKINERLGKLAQEYDIPMGLGSQRAGLKSEELASTYAVARKNAPHAFLIANIGGAQLSKGLTVNEVKKIVDMIRADALVIHLNPLQELIQPEGEPKYSGVLDQIAKLVMNLNLPVMVKEVGAGISREVASKLEMAGVSAINIAGSGGTSWAGVEKIRADAARNKVKIHLGELFWDWGIPTAISLIEVKRAAKKTPIIASGGLRNGLEVAKCVALGADMCAMAYPFLVAAAQSLDSLFDYMNLLLAELKSTMFLIGSKNIEMLKSSRYILTGALAAEVNLS
jgi:isopentenyl-diphosphate delta-isomerase